MDSQVLVGADRFMAALSHRAHLAEDSLYVQAMTFEGDAAGERLIELMIDSPAKDKRLIVDSFSKVVVSDHFVFGAKYFVDRDFREEIKNTKTLIRLAESHGIRVKFVNPTGFLLTKYPLRNHKKMMIVDGQFSFLGGINFSDHNFAWHDMMVEFDDRPIGDVLNQDFRATWDGKNQSSKIDLGENHLYFFNAINSRSLYEEFFELVRNAQKSITVISPYISEPLLPVLAEASSKGVEVKIISPENNNKGLFNDYLVSQSSKGFFKLLHHPGMFHLKAIMIDESKLVFGSSNYDLISYHFEQEVVIVSENKKLLMDFNCEILEPMKSASHLYKSVPQNSIKSRVVMGFLKGFCQVASQALLVPKP